MTRFDLCLTGRTSSHFTRVARIFAEELGLEYGFKPVRDLLSREVADYSGNPALRLPILETPRGTWFGTLNICRELARHAAGNPSIVWPEQLELPLLANAQELTLQAMANEVSLIMAHAEGAAEPGVHRTKLRTSLVNTLGWLDAHVTELLPHLPADRDLSFLEVTLFCLTTHLEFREVVAVAPYRKLAEFCEQFAARPSAAATPYLVQS